MALADVHEDIIPLLFDYLSHEELVECLLVNRTFYRLIMQYNERYINGKGYDLPIALEKNHMINIIRYIKYVRTELKLSLDTCLSFLYSFCDAYEIPRNKLDTWIDERIRKLG